MIGIISLLLIIYTLLFITRIAAIILEYTGTVAGIGAFSGPFRCNRMRFHHVGIGGDHEQCRFAGKWSGT